MSERSLFGMSGPFDVLSLFLRRGYNVAVPVVDVGDDAILIDDAEHTTHRLNRRVGWPALARGQDARALRTCAQYSAGVRHWQSGQRAADSCMVTRTVRVSSPVRLLLVMLLCLVACAVPVRHAKFIAAVPYATEPLPERTKIFLVAGGVEVANFAEEVVAQRALWLARGFAPDEIACYWTHPRRGDFRGDVRQYRDLADDLRGCYPASTAVLRAHLQRQATRELPFLYLYVTSHGNSDILPIDVPLAQLAPAERELFGQYVIQLGAGVGRGVSPFALKQALDAGVDPRDLAFSPAVLRELLRAFPPATPKYVVLQACHSGGFLLPDAVEGVSRLTAIAAARHDRTSFGCDAGAEFTYFGAVYLRRLLDMPGPPPALGWPALFTQIREDIDRLERGVDVRRSLPVFVQTQ